MNPETAPKWKTRQAKILARLREYGGPMTVAEVVESTEIPEHGVRSELDALRIRGLVEWRPGAGRIPGLWTAKGDA